MYGFTGKILRVDLTNSKISEVPTSNYVPKYIGGRGIATRIYWEDVGPEVKAFDPENELIFMTGPFQGTTAVGSGRLALVSKSPQTYPTESVADSNVGGYFAPELKFAGYDGIIVQGKAAEPVYLYIKDGQVTIMDARTLWGLTTYAAQEEIWKKHGWKTRVLVIGQAGENVSRIATIQTDVGDALGSGGFGGVMGSKNLKAIAVRGTGSVEVADPKKLLELTDQLTKLMSTKEGESVTGYKGESKTLARRSGRTVRGRLGDMRSDGLIKQGFSGCYACPLACHVSTKFVDSSFPPFAGECIEARGFVRPDADYYGYAPAGPIAHMWSVYNQLYGINAFEFYDNQGTRFNIIQLLYEAGILTPENTGWPIDKFGSKEFVEAYTRDISLARGHGKIWAQGVCRAIDYIVAHEEFGPNRAEALAFRDLQYPKGGNFGGYSVHHNQLYNSMQYSTMVYLAIGQRDVATKHVDTHFYGSCPEKQGSEEWYSMVKPMMMKWIGTDKPIEPPGYEDAEFAVRWFQQMIWELDCLIGCDFAKAGPSQYWSKYKEDGFGDPELGSKFLNAITGWNLGQRELWAELERPWIIERACACREGRRAPDDEYSDYWVAPGGGLQTLYPTTETIDKAKYRELLGKFYALVGWNADGVPARARLEELDLKDVADDLEARGIY